MKASRIQRKCQADNSLAEDVLTVTALEARLFGHAGFPEAADALAYDAVQRILAVGTRDGRVKIFGSDGVECTFRSPFQAATKQLQFLENKGALLRLTTDGDVQLWGVEAGGFVDSLSNGVEDTVTTACPLYDEPYVLLGCKSGKIQAAALLGSSGSPAGGARETCSLQKLPYEVSLKSMAEARGSIVALACSSVGNLHRVIVVHSASSPLVWDLRYKAVVVTTEGVRLPASCKAESAPAAPRKMSWLSKAPMQVAEPEQDAATCACWLSSRGDLFAVGYASGVVCLYSIPDAAQGEPLPPEPVQATLQRELKPSPGADAAMPIRAVWHVPGSKASEQSSILILGGQGTDEPDMLYMLPLEPSDDKEECEQHPLPWFGSIQGLVLVPSEHSLDARIEPAALITLNEGGQLIVYDMKTLKPLPLSLPCQELPPITASAFVHDAPTPEEGEERPHAFTVADLRTLHAASAASPERAAAHRWRWMLNGGKLPALDSMCEAQPLLLTGHRDGRVRMWDMACEVPKLLGTAPHDMGGPGSRLQAVSIIKVCPSSGLLLVGHAKGEARLYQFSSIAQAVTVAHISSESGEEPERFSSEQPAGFQTVLKVNLHESAISAAALCTGAGLLALASHTGSLSLIDLNRAAVLCTKQLAEQPISGLSIGIHSMLPQRAHAEKHAEPADSPSEDRLMLCVEAGDCSMTLLDARSGKPLSSSKDPWLRPKHPDSAVGMFLLNASGLPACMPPGKCVLPWAHNTCDTHGISFNIHGSLSGGSKSPKGDCSRGSPSPRAQSPRGFEQAMSYPESEASSAGAAFSTDDREPKQPLEHQHAEEQPANPWRNLAAKHNTETAESQCNHMHGLDALRMSLGIPGSPAAWEYGSDVGQGSSGPASPKGRRKPAGREVIARRGGSELEEADSSADELEDTDDNDDLLSAAVAAVEAEDKETKKGKKRFGLLHKGAKRQGHHKEHKEHASEQQLKEQPRRESTPGRDFTPQQKRALGRWVRSSIDKGRRISAEQPASEEPAGRSAAPADSVPARSPFADLPGHESFPGIQPAAFSAAAPSNRDQPASASSKGLHVGPRKGSQEEHNASASMQPQKADSGGRRASQPVGQEHHSSAARHSRPSMISSTQSTGLPSPVPKMAIRGSVSDNSHERFSAPHNEEEPAEASSSGVISYIVLASSNHLRLYAIENIREADRSTAKKVNLSQPIAFAGVFASSRGPGIACLSPTGILHVYTLPGLELLVCQELQDGLTFPWAWKPEQAQVIRAAAVAQDGQLAMVSACGELARLGLVTGTPEPATATSLYDWDLATAALAASHAVKRQLDASLAHSRLSQQPSPQPKEQQASIAAPPKKGLGSFLSQVKDAASRVVDDTSKNLNQGLDKLGARGPFGADRAAVQTAPDLATVMTSEPAAESHDVSSVQDSSAALSTADAKQQRVDEEAQRSELMGSQGKRVIRPQPDVESAFGALFGGTKVHGKPAQDDSASHESDAAHGRDGRHLWSEEDQGQGYRAELFKGAKTGVAKVHAATKPGVRTAEDIKAAYGRSSNTKRAKGLSRVVDAHRARLAGVEGLSGVMNENRARLAERGEKLRGLQDKMEAMSSDAEDFASMAKRLRDREANKKWWQL